MAVRSRLRGSKLLITFRTLEKLAGNKSIMSIFLFMSVYVVLDGTCFVDKGKNKAQLSMFMLSVYERGKCRALWRGTEYSLTYCPPKPAF